MKSDHLLNFSNWLKRCWKNNLFGRQVLSTIKNSLEKFKAVFDGAACDADPIGRRATAIVRLSRASGERGYAEPQVGIPVREPDFAGHEIVVAVDRPGSVWGFLKAQQVGHQARRRGDDERIAQQLAHKALAAVARHGPHGCHVE